jgi:hypothetical protein
VLSPDVVKYHDAFRHLGASRHYGQGGPLPIAVSEVKAYLDLVGIESPRTRMKYLRLIQRMDQVELAHIHNKLQANRRD